MMFKKGSPDQLISSLFVLVGLIILMGLFVFIVSNVAYLKKLVSFSEPENYVFDEQAVESKALMDVFLSDGVNVNGKLVVVRNAISSIAASGNSGSGNSFDYSMALQDLFKENYSCGGKNALLIVQDTGFKGKYGRYVDYPTREINKAKWDGPDTYEYDVKQGYSDQGYTDQGYTVLISGTPNFYVTVNGGAVC